MSNTSGFGRISDVSVSSLRLKSKLVLDKNCDLHIHDINSTGNVTANNAKINQDLIVCGNIDVIGQINSTGNVIINNLDLACGNISNVDVLQVNTIAAKGNTVTFIDPIVIRYPTSGGGNGNFVLGYNAGANLGSKNYYGNAYYIGYNVAIGTNALATETSTTKYRLGATRSVAIGYNALKNTVASPRNVAIGYNAFYRNPTTIYDPYIYGDYDSVVIGYDTCSRATGVGTQSSVLIGCDSGKNSYSFSNSVIVGARSARGSSGYINETIVVGNQTLLTPKTNVRSIVAIGNNTLTGCENTLKTIAIGSRILQTSPQGSQYTIAIGDYSQNKVKITTNNISIGHGSLRCTNSDNPVPITTLSNNVVIGVNAMKNVLTGADNNVAIGHESLQFKTTNGIGAKNICIGFRSGHKTTTGSNNVCIGYKSNYNDVANTLGNRIAIGSLSESNATGAIVIGSGSIANTANAIVIGTGATSNAIESSISIGADASPMSTSHSLALTLNNDSIISQSLVNDTTLGVTINGNKYFINLTAAP